MHIPQFLEYIRLEKRYSAHTVKAYGTDLLLLQDYLITQYEIEEGWRKVTHAILRSYVLEVLESGLTPKTVKRKISTFQSFFKYLIKQDVVEINPAAQLVAPKVAKRLVRVVNEDDLNRLIDSHAFDNPQDAMIIEAFYQTGMRSAELIDLIWQDFEPEAKTLKVTGKRNKQRFIPLSDAFAEKLLKFKNSLESLPANDAPVFSNSKGEKLYPKFVYQVVNKYLSSVNGVEKKSPHILRHSFATHMLNRGADINAVKELLGHANLAATQVYTHNSIDKLKQMYNQAHPRGPKNN